MVPTYGDPTVAAGGELSVSTTVPGAIVIVSGPETVCTGLPESVALTVSVEVPAAVGVPLTRQPATRLRPAGSAPVTTVQL